MALTRWRQRNIAVLNTRVDTTLNLSQSTLKNTVFYTPFLCDGSFHFPTKPHYFNRTSNFNIVQDTAIYHLDMVMKFR